MDYLNNDLILHKIIVFLLLLLIYSLLSNLIYWKNLNWIKNNLPFGEYINFILVKLNGDNSIINIIFIFLILIKILVVIIPHITDTDLYMILIIYHMCM